eukprot:TRINITY_DN90201_c0_g1_i1.p1 TRINITY_DN90201_c0_g1~~TRINITY_DN90201_c0_g1_i1.p1  ORF type:complete len:215 (-),score=48.82 TRINITY_DN90201_c0_g1_i1:76-642(-)
MVDVFLSHSWHDEPHSKWSQLETWAEKFRLEKNRAPILWLDKTCIDQTDIATDLQCLPVFLAACNGLLILAGDTYVSRLWCVMELFVYVNMQPPELRESTVEILLLGDTATQLEDLEKKWSTFSAADCSCFKQEDKDRIMKVIDAYPGGIAEFDVAVRALGNTKLQTCLQERNRNISVAKRDAFRASL